MELELRRLYKAFGVMGLALGLTQCGPQPVEPAPAAPSARIASLDELLISGRLIVLTLDGPTIHTTDADTGAPTGYEIDLVRAFAIDLGVSVRYEVMEDIESLLAALDAGEGHIAAANLTVTEERARLHEFGPAYRTVREQLVCNDNGPVPTRLDRLPEARIVALEGSSYLDTLQTHARMLGGLEWDEAGAGSAMPLLEQVQADLYDCTLADSHLADFARRRLPDLVVGLDLSQEQSLAWAYDNEIEGLGAALDSWFAGAHATGFLEELDERWFGRFGDFDYVDVAEFINRVETRLPEYEALFRLAADDSPFEWELIAAQSYQESHWDPDAVSATGVEGLMMLTLSTAERVGIEDRTDPRQSIEGGVAYLSDLYRRVPESVTGQDRLWFALAAYNVGMGHMYDTRALAERLGRDKNNWEDLEATLPLLSDPDYYPSLRYGYARGYEPVAYVQKVREYRALLEANRL
jgi:membrane-bound lytic murein transglycosylase F